MIIEINSKHTFNGKDMNEKIYVSSKEIVSLRSDITNGKERYHIEYTKDFIEVEKNTFDKVKEIVLKEDEKIALNKADKELLAKVILNTECEKETKLKMLTNLFNSEEARK